jgi:hypothetical protein
MSTKRNRPTFQAIREIPKEGVSEWEYAVLTAMKEDLEILMGTRTAPYRALTAPIDVQSSTITQLATFTARGNYYQASGAGALAANAQVPTLADYILLAQNVKDLIDDVARLTTVVRALADEFKD